MIRQLKKRVSFASRPIEKIVRREMAAVRDDRRFPEIHEVPLWSDEDLHDHEDVQAYKDVDWQAFKVVTREMQKCRVLMHKCATFDGRPAILAAWVEMKLATTIWKSAMKDFKRQLAKALEAASKEKTTDGLQQRLDVLKEHQSKLNLVNPILVKPEDFSSEKRSRERSPKRSRTSRSPKRSRSPSPKRKRKRSRSSRSPIDRSPIDSSRSPRRSRSPNRKAVGRRR